MYAIGSKSFNNTVQENSESKYRYYDKRTGQPFTKNLNDFTTTDIQNIDYIERLQNITGISLTYPGKVLYTIGYHQKIVQNGQIYTITPFPGKTSSMTYYAYNFDTLQLPDFQLVYDKSTNSGSGTIHLQGVIYPNYQSTMTINSNSNQQTQITDLYYSNSSYADGGRMATITMAANGEISTFYYVGKSYVYSSVSSLMGGVEDHATVEIQDSAAYSDNFALDGAQNIPLWGSALQDIHIGAKTGQTPTITGGNKVSFLNITGLYLKRSVFTKDPKFTNCSQVVWQ